MRRILCILLASVLWFSYSGIAAAAHHAYADADGTATHHHDESKCRICAALHAPLIDGHTPLPELAHQRQPVLAVDEADATPSCNAPLSLTCRGPPAC